ncbi:hypothetical protein [Streptomyces subrutilus]|nr:hypothetical protein [Streptomyces subrutilus]
MLTGGPGVEETVRGPAARESGCCSFLIFTVTAPPLLLMFAEDGW